MFSYCLAIKGTSGKLHLSCSFTAQQGGCQVEFYNSVNGQSWKHLVECHSTLSLRWSIAEPRVYTERDRKMLCLCGREFDTNLLVFDYFTLQKLQSFQGSKVCLWCFSTLLSFLFLLFYILCLLSLEIFQASLLVLSSLTMKTVWWGLPFSQITAF